MDVTGFDAYQHHNWRESDTIGPLTTSSCSTVRGDTPLIVASYDGYNMTVNDKTFMTITSGATDDHHIPGVIYSLEGNGSRPSHSGSGYSEDGRMFTLNTIEKHSVCYCIQGNMVDRETQQGGLGISKDICPTLNTQDKHSLCYGISRSMLTGGMNAGWIPLGENVQPAMTANGSAAVCYQIGGPRNAFCETDVSRTLDTACLNPGCNEGGMAIVKVHPTITGALCANSHPGSYTGQDAFNDMLLAIRRNEMEGRKYVLRRLTPLECCRLQGFPDWWTDGVEGSDSAIYKMWGNGIALPCAADVLGRIAKEAQECPAKTNNADAEVSAK